VLTNDIVERISALSRTVSFYTELDDVRQAVLVDMSFYGDKKTFGI